MATVFHEKKIWCFLSVILIVIGGSFALFAVGHLYFGLALVFFGVVIAVYLALWRLSEKHPKQVKIFRMVITLLLLAGTAYFIFLEVLILSDARTDTDREPDYLIVLGAGVNGTSPSLSLRERLNATEAYLNAHPHTLVVVSGGQGPGEEITEAECMRDWLVSHGIEDARIIMEPEATSTDENLRFSLERIGLLSAVEDPVIGIVSSDYHLHRAKLMARNLGVDAVGVSAPTGYPTLAANYYIREAFGLTHYYVFGY